MATFVRNLHTPYVADTLGLIPILWYYAELLRLAGYTYDSDSGDAAWASTLNVLIDEPGGAGGFQVDPNEPLIVTDPLARFTQAMVGDEAPIVLRASNDVNKGAWRMVELLSTSKVRIDYDGRPPYGWTPETGIPGRVTISDGLTPGNGAWIMFNAPSPSRLQVRLVKTSSTIASIYARPAGQPVLGVGDSIDATGSPTMTLTDAGGLFRAGMVGRNITISNASNPLNNGTFPITGYVSDNVIQYTNANGVNETFAFDWEVDGDPTETSGKLLGGNQYADRNRIQMVADGVNVFLLAHTSNGYEDTKLIGELESVETEDETPGFVWGSNISSYAALGDAWSFTANMLDHVLPAAPLEGFPTYLKSGLEQAASEQWNSSARRRLVNGYAFGRSPWVVMGDTTAGGYVRGRLPLVVFTSTAFVPYQPLDGAGLWQYITNGFAVPRNGPNDPLILT